MTSNDFKRTDRIAELIQHNLAQIIQREMRDPRLPKFIGISFVRIAPDLSHAKIYFTVLNEEEKKITASILNTASGFLRAALAKSIKLRIAPQLRFVYDDSIAYSRHLNQLIDQANPANNDNDNDLEENSDN